MYNLALAYTNGIGTSPDAYKAFEWLNKAAKAEYPDAIFGLAMAYSQGS